MINVTVVSGNLVRDPKHFPAKSEDDTAAAYFTVAVTRQPGKDDSPVDFIECRAYGKTAGIVEAHLAKGSSVTVNGNLRTGSKDDRGAQRSYMYVRVGQLQIHTWKNGDASAEAAEASEPEPADQF